MTAAKRLLLLALLGQAARGEWCAPSYNQCGGQGWNGPWCCQSGCNCKAETPFYSQCVPVDWTKGCGKSPPPPAPPSAPTTPAPPKPPKPPTPGPTSTGTGTSTTPATSTATSTTPAAATWFPPLPTLAPLQTLPPATVAPPATTAPPLPAVTAAPRRRERDRQQAEEEAEDAREELKPLLDAPFPHLQPTVTLPPLPTVPPPPKTIDILEMKPLVPTPLAPHAGAEVAAQTCAKAYEKCGGAAWVSPTCCDLTNRCREIDGHKHICMPDTPEPGSANAFVLKSEELPQGQRTASGAVDGLVKVGLAAKCTGILISVTFLGLLAKVVRNGGLVRRSSYRAVGPPTMPGQESAC